MRWITNTQPRFYGAGDALHGAVIVAVEQHASHEKNHLAFQRGTIQSQLAASGGSPFRRAMPRWSPLKAKHFGRIGTRHEEAKGRTS